MANKKDIFPRLEKDKVMEFRRFFEVGLHSPLHKMVVEVLEKYEIYLHYLTHNVK